MRVPFPSGFMYGTGGALIEPVFGETQAIAVEEAGVNIGDLAVEEGGVTVGGLMGEEAGQPAQ